MFRWGVGGGVVEVGAYGFGVGALQGSGEGLYAVVVGGGLFLRCGEGGGELSEEVEEVLPMRPCVSNMMGVTGCGWYLLRLCSSARVAA